MEDVACRPFYGEYAWASDLLIARPVSRQCALIGEMFSVRGVAAGAWILDAGCGTGRYTVSLARGGYVVAGLDLSVPLIAEARRRAADVSLPVSFAVGDILALPPAPTYDGILCRGVLNDLLDDDSRRKAFFSFARALRAGGALILDVREWEATARRKTLEPVFEKSVETARGRLTFRSVTQLDRQRRRLLVSERHTLCRGGVERVSDYEFIMRCWTLEELQQCLAQAGFEDIAYAGDYDRAVMAGASDRLVSVASRTER